MGERPRSTVHPQTKRHLHNSQKLRAAAIREFAQHGLQGTKVSNIVAAAELTQPSFYRTWPSKEAAYEEIVSQTLQSWQDAAAQVMAGPPELPLPERMQQGLEHLYRLLQDDADLTRLVLHENNKNPDRYVPWIKIYTGVFQAAQSQGLINRHLAAESLAQAYTAITERLFLARLYTEQSSVHDTVQEAVQLLLPTFQKETRP